MIERWKPVVGYEGRYEVSDHGNVRSLDRFDSIGNRQIKGRTLKPIAGTHGYLAVSLHNGGRRVGFIHRLVLEAFVGPCPHGMEARHFPNRDRTDNRLANLKWGTSADNEADKLMHGTSNRGERCGTSKLGAADIDRIFTLRRAGYTQQQIADRVGVCRSNVSLILSRRRWAHLSVSTC